VSTYQPDSPPSYRLGGELAVYGSSRDSNPIAVLGQHTSAGAAWARTVVAADDLNSAVARLEQVHLTRPIETLEQVEANDWVAAAVARYVRAHLALFQPFVYVVVALVSDPARPMVYELNYAGTDLVEVGYINTDADDLGPRVVPRPD
jgi:hypothetical protein